MRKDNPSRFILLLGSLLLLQLRLGQSLAQAQALPFYPNGIYQAAIPSPETVLGFPVGERPARYDEVIRYLKVLADQSPQVRLVEFGETYEKRKLYYAIVTSEENLARLDEIQESLRALADPRKVALRDRSALIESTPAVAWMAYGIHGDELSSTDAALQLAYQLAAGMDSATMKIRRELVVCIDPMENPDGRERFLGQMQQWAGVVPNPDVQALQHTGLWPGGRGNHYLFDLNRDWFILAHPETQARVQALLTWNPQLVVDSHEMGSYDSYLFSPPREPINPNVSAFAKKWWKVFAVDQAKAFDRYGWSYYTGEWNDEWYPGYGSSWALYLGAVGILYEQASTDGSLVKRPEGTTLTYRESIHHHFVSSMANLTTAAAHRRELLKDFVESRTKVSLRESNSLAKSPRGEAKTYFIVPGKNPTRASRLVEKLILQHIEVRIADRDFQATGLHDYWHSNPSTKTLPPGTLVVSLDQPLGRLAKAILEFDPRMSSSFLEEERKELEKNKATKLYDVTAWALPLACGVECYWSAEMPAGSFRVMEKLPPVAGAVQNPEPAFGFLFDYSDDRAVEALAMLLQMNYKARAAKQPFEIEGRAYSRGSVLLKLQENPKTLSQDVQKVAEATGLTIYGVNTALSTKGPDLGGNDFVLLEPPRIAIVTGPPVNPPSLGTLWHLLDYRLKYRVTLLNPEQVGSFDLRKYNVLILPSSYAGPEAFSRTFGKEGIQKLRDWVESGGTLIGIAHGAAFLADTSTGLSNVRLRRQALKDLHLYEKALEIERKATQVAIDSLAIWEIKKAVADTARSTKAPPRDEKELALEDERMRLFMPRGAILSVALDPEHWLAFGAGEKVPAVVYTSYAYLSKDPVQTPGRFAEGDRLRLSGLLWPEARERWANTAYVTRESKGKGQVILFAGEPNFRGYFHGTERLLLNALFLGPGFGTSRAVPW